MYKDKAELSYTIVGLLACGGIIIWFDSSKKKTNHFFCSNLSLCVCVCVCMVCITHPLLLLVGMPPTPDVHFVSVLKRVTSPQTVFRRIYELWCWENLFLHWMILIKATQPQLTFLSVSVKRANMTTFLHVFELQTFWPTFWTWEISFSDNQYFEGFWVGGIMH